MATETGTTRIANAARPFVKRFAMRQARPLTEGRHGIGDLVQGRPAQALRAPRQGARRRIRLQLSVLDPTTEKGRLLAGAGEDRPLAQGQSLTYSPSPRYAKRL
jgi:hypothetical protein